MDRRVGAGIAIGLVLAAVFAGGLALGLAGTGLPGALRAVDALLDPPTRVAPDSRVLVREVRQLARLETARLTLEQRVVGQRGTDETWGWVGERLELIARGEAVAGVDLALLGEQDVSVGADGGVTVRLPPAELWDVHLDEEGSRVASRERGWFAWTDPQLEGLARKEAVRSLRAEALALGIEDQARVGAEDAVRALLLAAGAEHVRFE